MSMSRRDYEAIAQAFAKRVNLTKANHLLDGSEMGAALATLALLQADIASQLSANGNFNAEMFDKRIQELIS